MGVQCSVLSMIVDRSERRDDHHENDGDDDGAGDVERDENLSEQMALHTPHKVRVHYAMHISVLA